MTMTDLCRIGSRLRQARTEKHLPQAQLAELIDRSTAYIGLIECGKRMPGLETFMDIPEALGVTADYILFDAVSYGYRVRLEEYAERIARGSAISADRNLFYKSRICMMYERLYREKVINEVGISFEEIKMAINFSVISKR